jgi:stage II sporulation protein D
LGSAQEAQVLLGVLVIGRHPGDSQRVKDVLVVGQNSARVIAGTELRRLFNLPSTQFSLFQSDSSYIFSGRGYGHGLGLSQWGAKALADNGYNAEQILSYYYKDVTIEPLAQEGAI